MRVLLVASLVGIPVWVLGISRLLRMPVRLLGVSPLLWISVLRLLLPIRCLVRVPIGWLMRRWRLVGRIRVLTTLASVTAGNTRRLRLAKGRSRS